MDIHAEELLWRTAYGYGVQHGHDPVDCAAFAEVIVEDLRRSVGEHGEQKADELCRYCVETRFVHVLRACRGEHGHIFQLREHQRYAV